MSHRSLPRPPVSFNARWYTEHIVGRCHVRAMAGSGGKINWPPARRARAHQKITMPKSL